MDDPVRQFSELRRVAVVGVSRRWRWKIGRVLFDALRREGYEVLPVNPHAQSIAGVPCFADLRSIAPPPEGVLVAVPAKAALEAVRQCHELGIARVWLVGGAASAEVLEFCARHGLRAAYGSCPVQWLAPRSLHWLHRKLSELFRRGPRVVAPDMQR